MTARYVAYLLWKKEERHEKLYYACTGSAGACVVGFLLSKVEEFRSRLLSLLLSHLLSHDNKCDNMLSKML